MAELADAHGSGPCLSNEVQVQVLLSAPNGINPNLFLVGNGFGFTAKKGIVPENPDFIEVFAVSGGDFSRTKIVDVKWDFPLCGGI